jgi:hypothetical protein
MKFRLLVSGWVEVKGEGEQAFCPYSIWFFRRKHSHVLTPLFRNQTKGRNESVQENLEPIKMLWIFQASLSEL